MLDYRVNLNRVASAALLLFLAGCNQEQNSRVPITQIEEEVVSEEPEITESYSTYSVPVKLTTSPDGRWLACIKAQSEKPFLQIHDAKTGKQYDVKPLADKAYGDLEWSGSNRIVSSGAAAQVWKVSSGGKLSPVAIFGHPPHLLPHSIADGPTSWQGKPTAMVQFTTVSAVHQLGARLLTKTEYKGQGTFSKDTQCIEIFEPKSNKPIRTITPKKFSPSNSQLLVFAPSGAPRLLVGECLATFYFRYSLWEPRSGKRLWSLNIQGLAPRLDFTSDGKFMIATQVTGSHGRDMFPLHETLVFEAQTGKKVRSLPTQATVYAATISGDNLVTYGTQDRPEKKQHWTSIQFTNWRTGQKNLHQWMPAGVGQVSYIAASVKAGTVLSVDDNLVLWKTADLKQGKNEYTEVREDEEYLD